MITWRKWISFHSLNSPYSSTIHGQNVIILFLGNVVFREKYLQFWGEIYHIDGYLGLFLQNCQRNVQTCGKNIKTTQSHYNPIYNWTNVHAQRTHTIQLRAWFIATLIMILSTQYMFNSCSFNYKLDYNFSYPTTF